MRGSAVTRNPEDARLSFGLLLLTVSTGLIDAVSYLGLHVFTANMTGNILIMAFAAVGVPGLSVTRSGTSLAVFLVGAVIGGRLNVAFSAKSRSRWVAAAMSVEALLVTAAAVMAGVAGPARPSEYLNHSTIALLALAMGVRNAMVRKLALPDLTTTVLTLTVTGIASDSRLAGGTRPRIATRIASVTMMFLGAAFGAILLRYGMAAPLGVCAAITVLPWWAFGLSAVRPHSVRSEAERI